MVIYSLGPEGRSAIRSNVSYIYGDLRRTILRDQLFDEIVCISTLEHIGLDNTLIYTNDQRYKEARLRDYRDVLNEFRRLLVLGGRLLLTVPYGRYQNLGWLQQFDRGRLHDVFRIFDGKIEDMAFYRYTGEGWVLANEADCANSEYFDIHTHSGTFSDFVAAARAVACVVMSKK